MHHKYISRTHQNEEEETNTHTSERFKRLKTLDLSERNRYRKREREREREREGAYYGAEDKPMISAHTVPLKLQSGTWLDASKSTPQLLQNRQSVVCAARRLFCLLSLSLSRARPSSFFPDLLQSSCF
jgi:hypothetical protein